MGEWAIGDGLENVIGLLAPGDEAVFQVRVRLALRVRRCFSEHSVHRVWPSMALLGQSLQRPSSLRRCQLAVTFFTLERREPGAFGRTGFGCLRGFCDGG